MKERRGELRERRGPEEEEEDELTFLGRRMVTRLIPATFLRPSPVRAFRAFRSDRDCRRGRERGEGEKGREGRRRTGEVSFLCFERWVVYSAIMVRREMLKGGWETEGRLRTPVSSEAGKESCWKRVRAHLDSELFSRPISSSQLSLCFLPTTSPRSTHLYSNPRPTTLPAMSYRPPNPSPRTEGGAADPSSR